MDREKNTHNYIVPHIIQVNKNWAPGHNSKVEKTQISFFISQENILKKKKGICKQNALIALSSEDIQKQVVNKT